MKNLFIILILPLLLPFSLFAEVEPIWYGEYNDIRQMEDPTFIGDNDEQFILAEYMPLPKADEENPDYTYVYKMAKIVQSRFYSLFKKRLKIIHNINFSSHNKKVVVPSLKKKFQNNLKKHIDQTLIFAKKNFKNT